MRLLRRVLMSTSLLALSACTSATGSSPGETPTAPPVTTPVTTPATTTTTTDAPTTTSSATPEPSTGLLLAGDYDVSGAGSFPVPYHLTTTHNWLVDGNDGTSLILDRGNQLDQLFIVSSGAFPGTTPAEVVSNACLGSTSKTRPIPSVTLLGAPTVGAEGTLSAPCNLDLGGRSLQVGGQGFDVQLSARRRADASAPRSFRIIAATVNGHVVVVFGSSEGSTAADFVTEFDALVASMRPI